MKIIHITDTHLVEPGRSLYQTDPYQRLAQCIDDVVANHSDAAFCVITGDLAHKGELAAYQGIAKQLARLSMPVYPLPGNHDLRAPMREALPGAPRDEHGFMQAALRRPEAAPTAKAPRADLAKQLGAGDIDWSTVGPTLEEQGLKKCVEPHESLLATLRSRMAALR